MTQKLPSSEYEAELSWEEAVSRYLEDHPDYFLRYPEILSRLLLEHETGGKAISLIERQVQVLREQSQTLQRQMRELVSNARENDILSGRLHRFATAMIGCTSLDDVLDTTYDLLRQEFKLDAVVILLQALGLLLGCGTTGQGTGGQAGPPPAAARNWCRKTTSGSIASSSNSVPGSPSAAGSLKKA